MASELAPPQSQIPPNHDMTSSDVQQPFEAPSVNGYVTSCVALSPDSPSSLRTVHKPSSTAQTDSLSSGDTLADESIPPPIDSAVDAPYDELSGPTESVSDIKFAAPPPADPIPAATAPIDEVSSGIQPVADFIPKEASQVSHPTPPPDEPLMAGAADVDVEMTESDAPVAPPSDPEPEIPVIQAEPSLVRPRDDDGEDQPAAKRSRLEDEDLQPAAEALAEMADVPAPEEASEVEPAALMGPTDEPMVASPPDAPTPVLMEDAAQPPSEVVVETEPQPEPQPELQAEPKAEAETAVDVKVEASQPETQPYEAQAPSLENSGVLMTETPTDAQPAPLAASSAALPATEVSSEPSGKPTYSTEPMTTVQKNSLIEKTKNLKKTKNSMAFLRPVDHVALNIPTYPDIIKNPMDLTTMESNLKAGKYNSVQEYADDFDLIINNVRRFNGEAHQITQQGFSLQAYFRKMMETVPTVDMVAPPKPEKKRSPSITREKPPRRESRAPPAPTQPVQPAASAPTPAETYALQPDGTPQIRRQSSNRPARAIKPPQNREIPYAKPKRKAHQLELKFCEHVLDEIRSPKHYQFNHLFLAPVDPVALNIPHYRQVIKQPMDLGTMATKLKNGEYGTAAEFKKDFDLIIKNCLLFNPSGNPVRDMGIGLQRDFEALWAQKEKWERKNKPVSNRGSSVSDEDESGPEEEEEEDDEATAQATIAQLQKQLAEMQNQLSGMGKPSKKKPKQPKTSSKKVGSMSAAPKLKTAKPAPKKKTRNITYDEKQEISEAVPNMSEYQVSQLTNIITQNSAKHRDMGDDMELEIDDLPADVQVMLLEFVRKTFGAPKKSKARDPSPDDAAALDDDDFEPDRRGSGATSSKRKKHKPMRKEEQQAAISQMKKQLAQFATSGSESPTNSSFNAANAQADTSGDDESEESEEE